MRTQTFDLSSQVFQRNPMPIFAQMREAGPLVRIKLPLVGDLWLATTYEAVNQLLHDQQHFALEPRNAGRTRMAGIQWWMPRMFRLLTKNMLTSDEPDHRRLRGLVEQAFLRQSIEAMRGRIESLADQYLDQLERAAKQRHQGVDFIEHFARPFPLAVICELLGLPVADRPQFATWARRLTQATSTLGMIFSLRGIQKLLNYLKQEFQACRQRSRPGLISALVEAEQDGQRLSEDELLSMGFLLLLAGHETTVHLISGGVLTLLEHADQKSELMADWSQSRAAVDEVLRYYSPVQMTKPRYATTNVELFGQSIKRGEPTMALLASANCDPTQFINPEKFDIQRTSNHHIAFGTGIHVCLGLKLARSEGRIAFEKLFTRFPHIDLAINPANLRWRERIGMRALTSLPVKIT